jgi:hypothetical protein
MRLITAFFPVLSKCRFRGRRRLSEVDPREKIHNKDNLADGDQTARPKCGRRDFFA